MSEGKKCFEKFKETNQMHTRCPRENQPLVSGRVDGTAVSAAATGANGNH